MIIAGARQANTLGDSLERLSYSPNVVKSTIRVSNNPFTQVVFLSWTELHNDSDKSCVRRVEIGTDGQMSEEL
jgi:hypothetical protein